MIEGSHRVMYVDLGNLVEDVVDQIIGNNGFVFHRQIVFLERGMTRLTSEKRSEAIVYRDEILQSFDVGLLRVIHLHSDGLAFRLGE